MSDFQLRNRQSRWPAAALFMAAFASNSYAVDGVILIDQNRALAGNVTPGDTPGFPVSITQRGSYKLSGNLTVANNVTTAIEVSSDFVTIDLNGFSIVGPIDCSVRGPSGTCQGQIGGTSASGHGIRAGKPFTSAIYFNITIRNGTIQGMGNSGIDIFGDSIIVEDMHVRSNGGAGITIVRSNGSSAQTNAIVRNSSAQLNRFGGITVEAGLVADNVAGQNGTHGIHLSQGTAVRNVCTFNALGLELGSEVSYIGNTLSGNFQQVLGGVNLGQNLCGTAACP